MKRRTKVVALATSLLVGVSMMGVGFASWVISNNAEATSTGNVKAESVTDNYVKLEANPVSGGEIIFGAPEQMSAQNPWLTNSNGAKEKLTTTITLTVSANIGDITMSLATEGYTTVESTDGFWKAVEANYIATPVVTIDSQGTANAFSIEGTLSESGNLTIKRGEAEITSETTITLKITFGWGSAFESKNPYNYYNDGTKTAATHHSDANTKLSGLYDYLNGENGLTYTFTFVGSLKA